MPPTHKKPQKIKNYVETFIDFMYFNKYNKVYILYILGACSFFGVGGAA